MYVLNELSAAVNYVRWRIKLVYLPNNYKRCKFIFVRCILFCAIYYSFALSYNIHFNVDFAFDEIFYSYSYTALFLIISRYLFY